MQLLTLLLMIGSAALAQGDKQEDFKGIDLFKIRRADPYPAGIVEQIIDGLVSNKKDGKSKRDSAEAAGLHAYRAEIIDPRKHKPSQVNLLVVRLTAPFVGGRLAVAVDSLGDIIAMDLMGHPDFSKDDFSIWHTFLFQFLSNPVMGTDEFRLRHPIADSPKPVTASKKKTGKTKAKKGRSKKIRRFMAGQRHLMKSNILFSFHVQRAIRAGRRVLPQWFQRQAEMFGELKRKVSILDKILSESQIDQYREDADKVIRHLNELKESASRGVFDKQSLQPILGKLSISCKNCHGADSPDESAALKPFMKARRTALALPTGRLKIGYDVALSPGLSKKAGKSIVKALRTALRVDSELATK